MVRSSDPWQFSVCTPYGYINESRRGDLHLLAEVTGHRCSQGPIDDASETTRLPRLLQCSIFQPWPSTLEEPEWVLKEAVSVAGGSDEGCGTGSRRTHQHPWSHQLPPVFQPVDRPLLFHPLRLIK